ncbi:voltage-gated chloride channel protein [Capsaspora owczarzaki ATCC 30864]|uniref:Chloride channel protein n=1 Tax=Capsaspora owczarzaki (strain ATCC 30864) TaxID=595528 RepID=A0A0D2UKQ8_CAPO3|nr:voltage-gated chloride channel protein [Capsaspora owczarzaki ATCC 30864]KJE95626.1 voltage-gated chloride channel protein [Capsaspora owczarzaki ATCC 30864]|eukprot:XP_004345650.2 voltage-gated chloride channel protein [Capsaspora owczarzaki ATCC 30864]
MDANLEDFQELTAVSSPGPSGGPQHGYSFEETMGYGRYKSSTEATVAAVASSSKLASLRSNVRMNNNADVGGFTGDESVSDAATARLTNRQRDHDEESVASTTDAPAKDLRYYDNSFTTLLLKRIRYWFFERFGDDWIFLALLGILSAFIGLAGDLFVDALSKMREQMLYVTDVVFGQYVLWILFSITFGVFAIGFTHYVAPTAVGSGIPEMKTILKGIDLFHYLSLRTLLAKFMGLCTALGAGLPLGKEGPSVHISSIISHKLSRHVFKSIGRNEARRMEMLSAACAVGVSSNFGAPIGGVLFSIEVTSTYFAVRNYWRGFFAAVMAALMFRLFALVASDESTITALFTTEFDEFPYNAQELFAFAIIGVIAGFLAAFFVWTHRQLIEVRRRVITRWPRLGENRYIYPTIVIFLIATFNFPKFMGHFMGLTQKEAINELFSSTKLSTSGDWDSPNIFFTLLLFMCFKFIMTALAVALPVPAGVFVPIFVVGAAYGRFMGELMAVMFPHGISDSVSAAIIPGGYAVVGAAALAAGVTHTISTSVIVFELTGQIHHILPVMIAVLISNAVSQALMPSFYESIIQIKKLPYLPDLRKKKTYNTTAGDIMNSDLFWISAKSTYADIQRLLAQSHHRSYPIVDSEDNMILIGSIRRDHLESMLARQLARAIVDVKQTIAGLEASIGIDSRNNSRPGSRAGSRSSSRAGSRSGSPTREFEEPGVGRDTYLAEGEIAVRRASTRIFNTSFVSEDALQDDGNDDDGAQHTLSVPAEAILQRKLELLRESVDLSGRRVDASPFQIVARTSLHKVHTLFSLLGLTHAFVTSHGRVVGVVTLKELRAAIEGTLEKEREEERRQLQRAGYTTNNGGLTR